MSEYYTYPPTPPAPPARRRHRGLITYLAILSIVVAGAATYIFLQRLSDQVLTIIATIGCAGGMALPGLLITVLVVRRNEQSRDNDRPAPQPQMTQPMMMVVPPMALPQPQYNPYQQAPAAWDQVPIARHFTIVGDNGLE